ncbi:class I SAM-dependent methyltransferase [Desulfosudis oleivorans]|uniref:Tellurite resistance protein TehB n=1 Tax=Desulfosudis oleivorans (strain DSM 6200 / JCM 39069 / Hxd3) TaxID=96561 RepID=A8ZWB3_DESOH|nr:methyltransferase domain-containing protein [Desulfosudis oleivorans]ABW66721.1 Tellurite resistance protein TehB [Desulfosudis oleivorans Hxd3]
MHEDRTRWNKKYTDREWTAEPSDIVRRFYSLAKPGMALDIGAGTGRNSVFLAEQGFDVVAVDIAEKGLAQMAGAHANLLPVCADLDVFEIPENRFSLIANILFLNRRLFPWIMDGLAPGGVLIFETYIDFPSGRGHRRSRDFCLAENELLYAFAPLHILYYEETQKTTDEGTSRLASLAAVKK